MEAKINESELKRHLIRSLRNQGGLGHRFEDKYAVGFPDCVMIPKNGPVFFVEVKILHGAKLVCTERQAVWLEDLDRPQAHSHAAVIGYRVKDRALYIGKPGDKLLVCRWVPAPKRLDSTEWPISDLLDYFESSLLNRKDYGARKPFQTRMVPLTEESPK